MLTNHDKEQRAEAHMHLALAFLLCVLAGLAGGAAGMLPPGILLGSCLCLAVIDTAWGLRHLVRGASILMQLQAEQQ